MGFTTLNLQLVKLGETAVIPVYLRYPTSANKTIAPYETNFLLVQHKFL